MANRSRLDILFFIFIPLSDQDKKKKGISKGCYQLISVNYILSVITSEDLCYMQCLF